jgi:hypothetical protein
MFKLFMSNMILAGAFTSTVSNTVATFVWLWILLRHCTWDVLRAWNPGVWTIHPHPEQPRLPRMTPKPRKTGEGVSGEWKPEEATASFVFSAPPDGEDATYQTYTLVARGHKFRGTFRRLFKGGSDRYVFWNLGSVSHQIFHFGDGLPLPKVIDPNAKLVCCHPEQLPAKLREQHLFPNGIGPVHVKHWQTDSVEGYYVASFTCRIK